MWFDVVGFSISHVPAPEKLAFDIKLIRQAARNRNMAVIVGGMGFSQNPALAATVGADATALDGPQALARVADLMPTRRALTS